MTSSRVLRGFRSPQGYGVGSGSRGLSLVFGGLVMSAQYGTGTVRAALSAIPNRPPVLQAIPGSFQHSLMRFLPPSIVGTWQPHGLTYATSVELRSSRRGSGSCSCAHMQLWR